MNWNDLKKHIDKEHSTISEQLDRELKTFGKSVMNIWFGIIPTMYALNAYFVRSSKEKYRKSKKERILQLIIGSKVKDKEIGSNNFQDVGTLHRTISRNKRNSNFYKNLIQFSQNRIEEEKYFERSDSIPIIFEEAFSRPLLLVDDKSDSTASTSIQDVSLDVKGSVTKGDQQTASIFIKRELYNLVILVHGFQGTHFDMLKIKHYFSTADPKLHFYCAKENEGDTTQDIWEMGLKLAAEISKVIEINTKHEDLNSISFIGHSLGGLIIRAALPHLVQFKDYFKTFMTFSTPHLGVGASDSKLVETGLSFISSWKKMKALDQMSLKDHDDPKKTFLYRLSEKPGFGWFKEVVLVSSPQDTYSPFDSSRIQISMKNSSNLKTSQAYSDMVDNLLKKIQNGQLRRVDVCMKFNKTGIDTFIGRAAHIAFLSDGILLESLSYRYCELL